MYFRTKYGKYFPIYFAFLLFYERKGVVSLKFKKALFIVFSTILLSVNTSIVFANPNDTIKNIEGEIQSLEFQQTAASKTASLARLEGYPEDSKVISSSQTIWYTCEQKKLELAKKLQEAKNSFVYAGTFKLTGYCPCYSCSENWGTQTASGSAATEGITIAADTGVLPLGTKVYIEGIGERTVQDVGGAIKGNKIDIFVSNHSNAYQQQYNLSNAKLWILK